MDDLGKATIDDAPTGPRFVYRALPMVLLICTCFLNSLVALLIGGLNLLYYHFGVDLPAWIMWPTSPLAPFLTGKLGQSPVTPYVWTLMGLQFVAIGAWFWYVWRRDKGSIALTRSGVYIFRGGKIGRAIPWREVTAITREAWFRSKAEKPSVIIRLATSAHEVTISPEISDFTGLCGLLSRYARDQGIKLQAMEKRGGNAKPPVDIATL